MIPVFVPIILTVLGIVFDGWYIYRTPKNLRKWYCLPVTLMMLILLAGFWFLALN